MTPTTDTPWLTPFQAKHKCRPSAKRDGIATWLRDEIAYLEAIKRTDFGDGSLSAYRAALEEVERVLPLPGFCRGAAA